MMNMVQEHGCPATCRWSLDFSHEGKPCSSGVVNNTSPSAVIF